MLSRDEMIALIDPETRPATLELIREGGYMGITGDMGACMALNDACKRASAELRAAREINGQPLSYDELLAGMASPYGSRAPQTPSSRSGCWSV